MKVGGGVNNEGLVFGYDASGFKFSGEPTTNYIWHQNAVKQETYTTYSATSSGSWNANHRKAIQVVNSAGSGITGYVNTGVGNWENTFHCIWEHDDELDKPVAVMYCYDGNWKAKSFGASMSAWNSYGMSAGDKYTISWLQWTNNLTKAADTGFYSRDTSGTHNFHDGRSSGSVTSKNTKTHTWERVYHTYTVSASRNLTDSYGSVYMYGHPVGSNSRPTILKIADVQLELKDHPTKFSPTLTRSNTESLIDLGPYNFNLDTSNIQWSSLQHPHFHGASHYMDLSSNPNVGDNSASWEFIVKFDVVYPTDTSVYRQMYIQESSVWVAQYVNRKVGIDIAKDNGAWFDGNGGSATGSMVGPVNSGTWYHIVFTWDGTSVKGYFNSQLQFTTNVSGLTAIRSGTTPRRIGMRSGTSQPFFGDLPVVRTYSTALSDKEVEQNYLSYKPRFGLS